MKKARIIFLFILLAPHPLLHAIAPEEQRIAELCRAKKLIPRPTPTTSPIAQAVDAEEEVEEEEITPDQPEAAFQDDQELYFGESQPIEKYRGNPTK